MRALLCILLSLCLVLPCTALEPASVVTVFHIRDGKITPVSSQIVYGGSPNIFRTQGEYILTTRTASGASETGIWISDPTLVQSLEIEEAEQSVEYMDDVDFTVILPFRTDTASVAVYDRNKRLLAETDLAGARNTFCMAHPLDERCRGSILVWAAVLIVVVAAIGAGGYLLLKRKRSAI